MFDILLDIQTLEWLWACLVLWDADIYTFDYNNFYKNCFWFNV